VTVVFEAPGVTVHHGDCIEIMRTLPDASIDAIVTDPPYNLSFMAKPWDALEGVEDAGFAYWLAGLIDGEGHFAIKAHARGTHAPQFTLKMRADERGTLEMIRRKFGHGTITNDTGANPMLRWTLGDKAGCQALVDMLDKYPLRAKKMIDFWTWRAAVIEWTERPRGNRWHGAADNTRMEQLRTALMERRHFDPVAWSGNEFQDWCRVWASEAYRILKPGGHLLAFGGSRTWHRLAAGIEDAGFEIRDSIAWLYGSGFPKSLDVSKAIDAAAGAKREVVAEGAPVKRMIPGADQNRTGSWIKDNGRTFVPTVTAPATDAARTWEGWGTALKPAFEPIVVARKPLAGTVAANVLAHGTGALNIDATRTAFRSDADRRESTEKNQHAKFGTKPGQNNVYGDYSTTEVKDYDSSKGRWPTNVVLDDHTATELDEQTGVSVSRKGRRNAPKEAGTYGAFSGDDPDRMGHEDSGGSSRFFPVFRYEAKAGSDERPNVDGVQHPTVKPLELMRWLVRLVTPPDGTVLEPFAGSGTTLEAAVLEGFQVVGIEREADYLPLIEARMTKPLQPVMFGDWGAAS